MPLSAGQSRSELLAGASDPPPIGDLLNLLQLCPNHHVSFDSYMWTLVYQSHPQMGPEFWLRPTLLIAKPSFEFAATTSHWCRAQPVLRMPLRSV